MNKRIQEFIFQKANSWEILGLVLFALFVSAQPFYMQHEIIMMETGIHLPVINAIFHGAVPYRDFFFLRGPVELYVPTLMMKIGGINSAVLPLFYLLGTLLTLILCVVLAGLIFRSRIILYAMIPVLVARTFPRISYYYWGGLRYAMGFLVLITLFFFFKTQRRRWIFLTGIACALSVLTTSEAGFSVLVSVVAALIFAWCLKIFERDFILRSFGFFILGLSSILVPYFLYLLFSGSLQGFIESNYVVALFNGKTYPGQAGIKPETFLDFLVALIPGTKFFKYLSVAWCYIFFVGFLVYKIRQKKIDWMHAFLVGLMFYGLVLYIAAFRKIEGHHFEMALQAEKFIYFFLIEGTLLYSLNWTKSGHRNLRRWIVYTAVVGIVLSSTIYAIKRFDHRFTMFKFIKKEIFHKKNVKGLTFLEGQETSILTIDRGQGHIVPRWQQDEILGVTEFIRKNTSATEKVFCYPEVGNFNFWADRPFVGRFPIGTFTWMYEPWYQESLKDFKEATPRFVVMTHLGHRTFPASWYFRNPRNKERFEEMTQLILSKYELVRSFEAVGIYKLKGLK